MKYLLLGLSSFTLIFYAYVCISESKRLSHFVDQNRNKMQSILLYRETRLDQKTSQLINLKSISFCDYMEVSPMRVSLSENQEIEIFSSSRPDMRLDYVKPIRTGDYSVENGILWTTLVNRISGNELQRAFAILELNKAENLVAVNFEGEVASGNCL